MAYSRPLDNIRVGGEIDAVCTRCRRDTNHRIVAMVDGRIKRVICLTCDSQHNYHQPPGQKNPAAVEVRRVGKALKKTLAPQGGPRVFAMWIKGREELAAGGLTPRPYRLEEGYQAGEAIEHPKFGLGFIQKIIPPRKMEVMFENDIKTLAMNAAGLGGA
ncbi:MAG: hypothetical protein LBV70_05185 [Candidatus Adiutrix sp.]|jgi:hypothetical protein|nr:hypothetical protein [Candidatus Adiutrix sp.]